MASVHLDVQMRVLFETKRMLEWKTGLCTSYLFSHVFSFPCVIKMPLAFGVERAVCQVTGVLFNTVVKKRGKKWLLFFFGQKKKWKVILSLWRKFQLLNAHEQTDIYLDLQCTHISAISVVFCKSLQIKCTTLFNPPAPDLQKGQKQSIRQHITVFLCHHKNKI